MLRRLVEASGRPLSFSLAQNHAAPDSFRMLLGALSDAVDAGLPMKAQVSPRAVGALFGSDLTLNPFSAHPAYQAIAALLLAARVAAMRAPAFRGSRSSPRWKPARPLRDREPHQLGRHVPPRRHQSLLCSDRRPDDRRHRRARGQGAGGSRARSSPVQ
ncbi:hypothetical protein AB5I41_19200 [Sphingomonas sp. MMS24-JH45]